MSSRPRERSLKLRALLEVGEHHRVLERRQARADLRHGAEPVVVAAAVAVAVDREQHLRLDLGEAVDDRPDSEVGRAGRPDRADARAREKRGDGLLDVREVGDDAVARADPEAAQAFRDGRRVGAQALPARLPERPELRGVHERYGVRALTGEDVLGIAQPRSGEPPGARHRPVRAHRVVRVRGSPSPRRTPRARPRTPRAR